MLSCGRNLVVISLKKHIFFKPYFSHCQYPRARYCQYLRVPVCIPVSTVCIYTSHIIYLLVTVFIRVILSVSSCHSLYHHVNCPFPRDTCTVYKLSSCDCQHPLSSICLYVHVSLSVLVCPCLLSMPAYYCLYSLVILSTSISPCQLSLTTCPCLFPHVNCLFSHGTGIVCIHGLLSVSAFICLFIRVIVCIALSTVYNRVLLSISPCQLSFLLVTVCNNVSTVFNFIDLLLSLSA